MRDSYDKLRIIEALREAPFIINAAKKIGVSRSTIYRWMESDKYFERDINRALTEGHKKLSDIAEMKLFQGIERGDLGAIKFYLSHNNPRYLARLNYIGQEKHSLLPGQTCELCGLEQPVIISDQEALWILEDLGNVLGYEIKKISPPENNPFN
ncbi:MAG: hypothetical protein M0R32_10730 [Candidatus Cloacimonetes bacterium]|jgi:hypothetical protein|nr:hypothetical protein [Candidatus Cloacimonadota bacterium]